MMKIILWGCTNGIISSCKNAMTHDTLLVAICDSNSNKWGVSVGGRRVISPDEIKDYEYDYIVVGALYSFNAIREELVQKYDCDESKIIPLLNGDSHYYYNGNININTSDLEKIFLCDKSKLIEGIEKHNYYNRLLDKHKDCDNKEKDNYDGTELIAHALGGYVRGEKDEYTNSLNALKYSIENGFTCFEVDIWGVASRKEYDAIVGWNEAVHYENLDMVCGSRLKMQYRCGNNYDYAFVSDLIMMLKEDPERRLIIDLKWNTIKDFAGMLQQLDSIIDCMVEEERRNDVKNQMILEVFNEETIRIGKLYNWRMYLTDYRDKEGKWFLKSAYLCKTYGISAVMIDVNVFKNNVKYTDIFKSLGIGVLVYTVDDIDEFAFVKSKRVSGCLTNFLLP